MDPSQPLEPEDVARLLKRIDGTFEDVDDLVDGLMTVLDTLDGTNCHLETDGQLRGINDRGEIYFGIPAEELLEKELLAVVRIEDERGRRLVTADLATDRRIPRGRVFRADGTSFAASINLSRIDTARKKQGAVLLILDIEDRLAEEQALRDARIEALAARRAERNTSLFLANMSHELRTPLNAIVGYSELMLDEARAARDTDRVAMLQKVTEASRHLTELIGSILDLTKVEAGKLELRLEALDLTALVAGIVEIVRPQAEARGVELALVELGPLPLATDAMRVRQVLFNLLSNAMKFTEAGRITVRVAPTADGAVVQVSDTGIGIEPMSLQRVFHEFEQADADTTERYGGTGLGLPLSRRLCQLLGGDLTATSTVGQGSTFTMTLASQTLH